MAGHDETPITPVARVGRGFDLPDDGTVAQPRGVGQHAAVEGS
jgi:hypothetical protein